ncbi:MAG: hypothetical protein Q4P25_02150 [Tissierellia bacterium]|nr:hypothetical protein [Tissierellia bacterium]
MKTFKRILSIIIFMTILILGIIQLNSLFTRKSLDKPWDMGNKIGGYFNENDAFTMMFFGTSHTYCSFQPLMIYPNMGAKSYILASQKQPLEATYYYMKEVLNRDRPKIFILDVYAFITNIEQDEAVVHSYIDYLPWSLNKVKMILKAVPLQYQPQAFFPLIMYHDRWDQLKEEDYAFDPSQYQDYLKGYVLLTGQSAPFKKSKTMNRESQDFLENATADFMENQLIILRKMMDICEKNQVRLLLVKTPIYNSQPYQKNIDRLREMIQQYPVEFIDFNDYKEEMGLDESDFYDFYHLNAKGAEKFNTFFINDMISKNIYFDMDHLDPQWLKEYDRYYRSTH